jgi:hypothetical protein
MEERKNKAGFIVRQPTLVEIIDDDDDNDIM